MSRLCGIVAERPGGRRACPQSGGRLERKGCCNGCYRMEFECFWPLALMGKALAAMVTAAKCGGLGGIGVWLAGIGPEVTLG